MIKEWIVLSRSAPAASLDFARALSVALYNDVAPIKLSCVFNQLCRRRPRRCQRKGGLQIAMGRRCAQVVGRAAQRRRASFVLLHLGKISRSHQ